jgi:hypothetical protein
MIFLKCEDTACACLRSVCAYMCVRTYVRACVCVCVCDMSLQKHLEWNNIMILLTLLLHTCLAPGSCTDSHA